MADPPPPDALRGAVIRAQSGYRTDVSALAATLRRAQLHIALVGAAGVPDADVHQLMTPDGRTMAAVFTSVEALIRAGERLGWTDGGGSVEHLSGPGAEVLDRLLSGPDGGPPPAGVVFDAGLDSQLDMTAAEAVAMLGPSPIPIVERTARRPTRGGEAMIVSSPPEEPPGLMAAVDSVLVTDPGVGGRRLLQVLIPERDVEPHLLLDILHGGDPAAHAAVRDRLLESISGIRLPPPGYLDIAFNLRF